MSAVSNFEIYSVTHITHITHIISTFCNKKYRILTFRNKTELYLTVSQQNNIEAMSKMWGQPLFCSQLALRHYLVLSGSLWLSLALPGSLWLSLAHCPAHSGSFWLSQALSGSLWPSLTLSGSLWLPLAKRQRWCKWLSSGFSFHFIWCGKLMDAESHTCLPSLLQYIKVTLGKVGLLVYHFHPHPRYKKDLKQNDNGSIRSTNEEPWKSMLIYHYYPRHNINSQSYSESVSDKVTHMSQMWLLTTLIYHETKRCASHEYVKEGG